MSSEKPNPPPESRIRILLADDHAVLRAGLRLLLNAQPDMTVVGEAETAEQTVALDARLQPDVVLIDLTLPAGSGDPDVSLAGLDAIRRIKSSRPQARLLVLTMHDDEGYLRAALEAGAVGYVLKRAADSELLSAIRAVHQGGTYLHPAHTRALLENVLDRQRPSGAEGQERMEPLSPREQEVLRLVALGYTNAQIAGQLFLSVKTIETYRARGMDKLGLTGRAALVRYAQEKGWLS